MESNNEITKRINESSAYSSRVAEMVKIVVCNYHNLPLTVFQSKSRKREVVICKQRIVYFLRKQLPKATLKHIGTETGYDHATVLHCIKTTQNLIDTDPKTEYDIREMGKVLSMNQDALTLEDISEMYYFVNMDECISIKMADGKSMVLVGYNMDEASLIVANNPETMVGVLPVPHKNTKLFILEKKVQKEDE
jgi:uncharacterized protein YbaR (Trm112 family)